MYGMLVINASRAPGTVLRRCSLWSSVLFGWVHSKHVPGPVCLLCAVCLLGRVASGVFICPVPPLAPYSGNSPDLSQFTDAEPLMKGRPDPLEERSSYAAKN